MSILQTSLSIQTLPQHLSFSKALTTPTHLFLHPKLFYPSLHNQTQPIITPKTTTIRMGGGPRTFPGGVSKWQWKRMQAKKAKQLLKARLCRERQIYEMRKRAELKAAVSDLERPWEVVEKAPNLFSVSADEQLKVLADRFQKPGGFDLWTEKDGPQLFQTVDELPSARFFPKGVVHSIKPYLRNGGAVGGEEGNVKKLSGGSYSERESDNLSTREDSSDSGSLYAKDDLESSGLSGRNEKRNNGKLMKNVSTRSFGNVGLGGSFSSREDSSDSESWYANDHLKSSGLSERNEKRNNGKLMKNVSTRRFGNVGLGDSLSSREDSSDSESWYAKDNLESSGRNEKRNNGKLMKNGSTRRFRNVDLNGSGGLDSGQVGFDRKQRGKNGNIMRGGGSQNSRNGSNRSRGLKGSQAEVYDMSLRQDGSYGIRPKAKSGRYGLDSGAKSVES